MNPALVDYLAQIQQQGMQQDQELSQGQLAHPFQSGSDLAMQSARNSMALTPEQKRSAFGRGMIAFGQQMSQPYTSKLAGLNQALGSGINAMIGHGDEQAMMNAAVAQEEQKRAWMQQKMAMDIAEAEKDREIRRHQHEEQHMRHEENLAEQKRSHDLLNQYRAESLGLRRDKDFVKEGQVGTSEGIKGLHGIEYAPLNSLTRPELNKYAQDSGKEISSLPINKKGKRVLNEMKQLIKEYPDVGTSFLNLLSTGEKSWGDLIMRNNPLVDKKKLNAIEKLEKLSSELRLDIIGSLPGQRGTDLVKRLIDRAAASGKTLGETTNYVIDETEKTFDNNIKRIKTYEDAKKKRMYPLFSTEEDEEFPEAVQDTMQESSPSQVHSSPQISREQALGELRRRGINVPQ